MRKKDLKELTELEFEEILLTIMVGIYVRTAVFESKGRSWKKIDEQLNFFLYIAEKLGFKNLLTTYNHARLPNKSLEEREERIIDDFIEDEFWEALQVRLGQRDFFTDNTTEELAKLKDSFWLPDKINDYYEKYENEFIKHGIKRLHIVKENKR